MNDTSNKQDVTLNDSIFFILSICVIISAFLKWAYMSEIRINDYWPSFKIIAVINGVGSMFFISTDRKAKRGGFIAIIINLIIFSIYYSTMVGPDQYGNEKSDYISLHFGFWFGFISTVLAFIIAISKLFSKKKNE